MSQNAREPGTQPGQLLSKPRLEGLLARRAPLPGQPASSLYLGPGEAGPFLENSGPEGRAWWDHLRGLGRPVLKSDTGIAGLQAGPDALVIVPPFPLTGGALAPIWDTSPLAGVLAAEYTVGVILLRLGRFSVALYRGDVLLSAKTGSRYVKGRHHAGGTSQKRFERIREGQARRLYDKACQAVETQFAPGPHQIDYILLGGDRFTLNDFLKQCPHLQRWGDKVLERRLNVRDPKRETLEQVAGMLRESRAWAIKW